MKTKINIHEEIIFRHIYTIRGEKVILDLDLARLYGVETRVLKQAVRRNIQRFPSDFMIELTDAEIDTVVSQNVIPSKSQFGGACPFAFTEQGIAMLSSILNSEQAIQVNIAIIRAFVYLRKMAISHQDLLSKIEEIEKKYNEKFKLVFKAIKLLLTEKKDPVRKIGYKSY
jgi:hypothetical protein